MTDNTAYFKIGTIVNTQGIKGDVRVMPSTDDPSRFDLLDYVLLYLNNSTTRFDIERVWYHKQFVIIKFKGIDDMTSAEKLKGSEVKIEPEFALPLGENEYYMRDLYDMKVLTDDGTELGEITDVIQTGANDVYSVNTAEGKTVLLPAIKDCILSVDVSSKKMVVHLMDGLI